MQMRSLLFFAAIFAVGAVRVSNQTMNRNASLHKKGDCETTFSLSTNTPPSTEWTDHAGAEGKCVQKPGVENIKLCGFASVVGYAGSNCDGESKTIAHTTDHSMTNCSAITLANPYFNSFQITDCTY